MSVASITARAPYQIAENRTGLPYPDPRYSKKPFGDPLSEGEIGESQDKALRFLYIGRFLKLLTAHAEKDPLHPDTGDRRMRLWRVFVVPPTFVVSVQPPGRGKHWSQDALNRLSTWLQAGLSKWGYVTVVEMASKPKDRREEVRQFPDHDHLKPKEGCCHKEDGCGGCLLGRGLSIKV